MKHISSTFRVNETVTWHRQLPIKILLLVQRINRGQPMQCSTVHETFWQEVSEAIQYKPRHQSATLALLASLARLSIGIALLQYFFPTKSIKHETSSPALISFSESWIMKLPMNKTDLIFIPPPLQQVSTEFAVVRYFATRMDAISGCLNLI